MNQESEAPEMGQTNDPRTLLGYRKNGAPIWLAYGGAPDDDGGSGDDGGGDDGGSGDDDGGDDGGSGDDQETAEQKAERLSKELKAARTRITKLNNENAKRRIEADKSKGNSEEFTKLQTQLQERDALEALRDAGAKGNSSRLKKAVRMLDSTDPALIDDAINTFKDDFPEFFKGDGGGDSNGTGRVKPPAGHNRGGGKGEADATNGAISKATQQMLKGSRRGA